MSATVELLFSVTVRTSVLVLLAWVVARLLRNRSAALRHIVWSSAAIGGLVLLAATPLAPEVHTTRIPVWQNCSLRVSPVHLELPSCSGGTGGEDRAAASPEAPDGATSHRARETDRPDGRRAAVESRNAPTSGVRDRRGGRADRERRAALPILSGRGIGGTWTAVGAVWAAGALIVLLTVLMERLWVRNLRHSSRNTGAEELADQARKLADRLGLAGPVEVVLAPGDVSPLSWGLWRPRILLPASAERWSDERRRAVLLHELGHARRRDVLTQTLAAVACALFWFNPLVWLAASRMRSEREHACDDLVIDAGVRSTCYARSLVDLARQLVPSGGAGVSLVGMTEGPNLVDRVDRLVRRRDAGQTPGRATTLASALGALAVLAAFAPQVIAEPDCRAGANAYAAYRLVLERPVPSADASSRTERTPGEAGQAAATPPERTGARRVRAPDR